MNTDTGFEFASDFNVEEEATEAALIPNGTYHGSVTSVSFDGENQALVWQVTLANNDGVCSDGETPIDGATLFTRNWFPKPGDENEKTKSGRMTKRQAKINMLKDFGKNMGIDISTPQAVRKLVENADVIGKDVLVVVQIKEYEGRVSNEIKSMKAKAPF